MKIRAYKRIDGFVNFEYWVYDDVNKGWDMLDFNAVENLKNGCFECLIFSESQLSAILNDGKILENEFSKNEFEIIKLAKKQFLENWLEANMQNHKQDSNEVSSE